MLYIDKYNGVWQRSRVEEYPWQLVSGNTYHFNVGVANSMKKYIGGYYSDSAVKDYAPLKNIETGQEWVFHETFEAGDIVKVNWGTLYTMGWDSVNGYDEETDTISGEVQYVDYVLRSVVVEFTMHIPLKDVRRAN